MNNEPPLLKRQWEILHKANLLISIHERSIADLEFKFAVDSEVAKQKYEHLIEEYIRREREVEALERSTENIATRKSIKKVSSRGISKARFSSKATPIKQIDNFLEKAKKEYTLLVSPPREIQGNLKHHAYSGSPH